MSLARAVGVIAAGVALFAMSYASSAPMEVTESSDAIVRLSIAARPERIETCRTVSDEELAKLAPQMRQRVICEGTTARYRLELRRNGELLVTQILRAGGLRHDRRMYFLRDVRVPPGASELHVRIVRIDAVAPTIAPSEAESDPEAARRQRGRDAAIPADVRLELRADIPARDVLLVTYDPEQRRLVASRRAASADPADVPAGHVHVDLRGFPDRSPMPSLFDGKGEVASNPMPRRRMPGDR